MLGPYNTYSPRESTWEIKMTNPDPINEDTPNPQQPEHDCTNEDMALPDPADRFGDHDETSK